MGAPRAAKDIRMESFQKASQSCLSEMIREKRSEAAKESWMLEEFMFSFFFFFSDDLGVVSVFFGGDLPF